MIYPELRNYLTKAASVETVQFFDAAIEILENYQVPEYMDIFDTVIGESTNGDDIATVDKLLVNLRLILNSLLTMQGIELIEEALPSEVNAIAEGLFMLASYEDTLAVHDILESDESTAEKICTLLTLVTPYQVEELMRLVDSVQESFIDDFKARLMKKKEEMIQSAGMVALQIKTYAAFKRHLLNAPIQADQYFQQIGSIGLPFEDYLTLYKNDNDKALSDMTASAIAIDLVSLTCLSSDGCNNALITIRKYLSTLFSDIATATKVDIAVSKLTVEISHAQA
jgi:hypothetical protein